MEFTVEQRDFARDLIALHESHCDLHRQDMLFKLEMQFNLTGEEADRLWDEEV